MAALTWILTLICAAGCPLSSASPVPHSASEVQVGQNVSLTCNLTSSVEITWYLLRSDQLLPLLTGKQSKLKGDSIIFHSTNSRINWERDQQSGLVSLKIHRVEEEDAGLYFCTERSEGKVLVNEGIRLTVNGVDGESSSGRMKLPCWSLGICVLPGLLAFCFMCVVGFYLCSGKPAGCCCNPDGRDTSRKVTEEDLLHYSSLRHPDKPRPSGRRGPGLVEENVTYSAVIGRKNPKK
ncbi:uncharacterized protein LOC103374121 [Stegastes partitus]|uniref:Uncharacterized protein LOC103374121 n=1 Tax=Stegastes partitus TaxID=144197 RepID=A0A9Y4U2R0_9TELE|nr:PREDICTED: uncharacterized protein LOC103374121 [Stegastes partitus]